MKSRTLWWQTTEDRRSKNYMDKVAYRPGIQSHLFQADYFRQVKDIASQVYKANSQMARWNNEGDTVDPSINEKFARNALL